MGKGAGAKHGNRAARARVRQGTGSPPRDSDEQAVEFLPPLKPRPRLFIGLGVLFALWITFLLVLYFITVFPHRHEKGPVTQPGAAWSPQAVTPSSGRG
jgi:hypothetical protein